MLQLESLPSYEIIGTSTADWKASELQLHFNKDGIFRFNALLFCSATMKL